MTFSLIVGVANLIVAIIAVRALIRISHSFAVIATSAEDAALTLRNIPRT
jgi:hypothetical protein